MFSYESIQWRAKQAARRDTTFLKKIPSSLLVPSSELLLAQKSLWVKVRLRQGACTSVLFAACRSLHLIQRWYTCFSHYALCIRSELQPDMWDEDEWCDESCGFVLPWEPRGAGCHWFFQRRGRKEPLQWALPSSPEEAKAQIWSVGTQTYQPGVHTSKVYKAPTMLTGNCLVEFIFALVRFKNTFLDPHVSYMNTRTFSFSART